MFNLASRKIIGINQSKVLTLPPDWIVHHNLEKGDSICISIDERGALLLIPEKIINQNKIITSPAKS